MQEITPLKSGVTLLLGVRFDAYLLPTLEYGIKLSQETGIVFPQINNWLDQKKESIPSADVVVILAKYFGCSIDFLLDMPNDRNKFNKRVEDRAFALQYRLDGFDFFSLV